MSVLFSQMKLRGVTFCNRVFVSPMCQYSSTEGGVTDWHLVHLGSRAVGGAGLVLTEATAVSPQGRISPGDAGIWSDELAQRFAPIVAFIRSQGAAAGIQLGHAGRKASTAVPWLGGGTLGSAAGGWRPLAPSAVPFADGGAAPAAMTAADLESVREQFVAAARRAAAAGFDVVELHAAHGYLLHEFLSPLSNRRDDGYGGNREQRMR
ncbi:MAG: oxidoreductase, partial [Acidobacteria bacterium 37-71-11]